LIHPSIAVGTAERARLMTLFVPRQTPGFVSRDTGAVRLRRVLIPIDHAPSPAQAVRAAYALCRTLAASDVHFIFLHVGRAEAAPAVPAPPRADWTSELSIWEGSVVNHILSVSETQDSDLIVMATRSRHGILGALRGSTTARVLRGAKCPVLTVPEGD
jgi:nucleotide-binding universal stress UspA family protein